MIHRSLMAVLSLLLITTGLSGAQTPPTLIKVGVLADNATDSWKTFRNIALSEAPGLGLEIDFRAPAPGTVEQQAVAVQQMLESGVKVLAICPANPEQQAAFLKETAAKVPMILLLKDAPVSDRIGCICPDDKLVGSKMAEAVSKCVPGFMKIAVLTGNTDSLAEKARMTGLKEGFEPLGMIVDAVRADHGDRGMAVANVEELLTKRPELAGYVGFQPYHAAMILKVAEANKRAGIIGIVGYGDAPELSEAFAKGQINGIIKPDIQDLAKQTLAALKSAASQDGSFAWPESKVVNVALISEFSPKTMGVKEQINAISGGWNPTETTDSNAPQPKFD